MPQNRTIEYRLIIKQVAPEKGFLVHLSDRSFGDLDKDSDVKCVTSSWWEALGWAIAQIAHHEDELKQKNA